MKYDIPYTQTPSLSFLHAEKHHTLFDELCDTLPSLLVVMTSPEIEITNISLSIRFLYVSEIQKQFRVSVRLWFPNRILKTLGFPLNYSHPKHE